MKDKHSKQYSQLIEGEEAERMLAMEEKTAPRIPKIGYYLLELRRILFSKPFSEPSYYLLRHQYSETDRYLLDFMGVCMTFDAVKRNEEISPLSRFRYKYYNLKYLKYFHKKPSKWTRITKYGDAPVYALTSEVAAGDPNFGKSKFSLWLPKPNY